MLPVVIQPDSEDFGDNGVGGGGLLEVPSEVVVSSLP